MQTPVKLSPLFSNTDRSRRLSRMMPAGRRQVVGQILSITKRAALHAMRFKFP